MFPPAFSHPSFFPSARSPFRFLSHLHRPSLVCAADRNLYAEIGIPSANSSTPLSHLKSAYRSFVRNIHPDVSSSSHDAVTFSKASDAWAILSDQNQRAVYDATGWLGVQALVSIHQRAAKSRALGLDKIEFEDAFADEGTLDFSLLSPGNFETRPPQGFKEHDDACPRSIEEAIWNIAHHEDNSTRYYTLWWIYRFRVKPAESALVDLLNNPTQLSGLKRRACLALGVIASSDNADAVLLALGNCLTSSDYYLRYRAAEALACIAQRNPSLYFPKSVVDSLLDLLKKGAGILERARTSKSGYASQEGLFDLDSVAPEVREKLLGVFAARRENERRSRRTTMTPQLGVDEIDSKVDEPYEWILKAVGAIRNSKSLEILDFLKPFTKHNVPLVRYAAHKALYILSGDASYAEELVSALGYGIEHHYSQRVICRDLGDVGYAAGAGSIAGCPMVENSFKIIALKNMLAKHRNDPANKDVRQILGHMDSLL